MLQKAFLLFGIFLSACATTGVPHKDLDSSLERIKASMRQRSVMAGTGFVVWKHKGKELSTKGVLILQWPDKLHLEVQDITGGTQAYLVLNRKRFWWYTQEAGEARTGRTFKELPLSAKMYLRTLLARPPLEKSVWRSGKEPYSISWRSLRTKGHHYLRWNPVVEQPSFWRVDKGGKRLEVGYHNYKIYYGRHYPMEIRLRFFARGKERFVMHWYWENFSPSLPQGSRIFQIPPPWAKDVPTRSVP